MSDYSLSVLAGVKRLILHLNLFTSHEYFQIHRSLVKHLCQNRTKIYPTHILKMSPFETSPIFVEYVWKRANLIESVDWKVSAFPVETFYNINITGISLQKCRSYLIV